LEIGRGGEGVRSGEKTKSLNSSPLSLLELDPAENKLRSDDRELKLESKVDPDAGTLSEGWD
jgi:hypothetical protein